MIEYSGLFDPGSLDFEVFYMDSFLRLYAIYRSVSRWQIVVRVYTESEFRWRVVLWAAKLAFVTSAVIGFLVSFWPPFFLVMNVAAATWMLSFNKARTLVFSEHYRLYPERIKYFEKDYEYIRYITFRERLESSQFAGCIVEALAFIESQIDTDSHSPVMSHPFVTFTLVRSWP